MEELFKVLKARLGERNWAVRRTETDVRSLLELKPLLDCQTSFKTFLLLHILMREGTGARINSYMGTLSYFGVSSLVGEGSGERIRPFLANSGPLKANAANRNDSRSVLEEVLRVFGGPDGVPWQDGRFHK